MLETATDQPQRTLGTAEEGLERLIGFIVKTTRERFPNTAEERLPMQAFAEYYRTNARVLGKRIYYVEKIEQQLEILTSVTKFQ